MDFFDRQQHARTQSRRLVWLFSLALLAALAVNNLLIGTLVAVCSDPFHSGDSRGAPFTFVIAAFYLFGEALVHPAHFCRLVFEWHRVLWISLGALLSIGGGCYYKIHRLADGGAVVAELLGGRRVTANPSDADEVRLRDVVEEMAIASGTSVPEIYVLDAERGINTFAAGHTHDDVAIGVTRGCLKLLTRDELQGVIAHEFSHVLNGDTRFNMRLIGLAHGFFWPTYLGRLLIYGQVKELPASASVLVEEDHVKLMPTAPLGGLLVILGSVSLPLVRLIKSGICRQREWLADAAAVQFTRNPDGIAGALKKIGGLLKQGRLNTPHAEVASHLYFVNCRYEPWFAFMATHPPLARRVTAIDPRFDGTFARVKMLSPNQAERDQAFTQYASELMAVNRRLVEAAPQSADTLCGEHLRQAAVIRLALPDALKRALRTPAGAAEIIYALLLSDDEATRARQWEILQRNLEAAVGEQLQALLPLVAAVDDQHKLPLAELAVPALRENGPDANLNFGQIQQQLIECNGSLDLFEYTLMKMVARQLRVHFEGPAGGQPQYGRVGQVLPECALLLSAVAHVGNEDEAAARSAFAQGAEFLDVTEEKVSFVPRSGWDLAQVDAALTKLAVYHEPLRRNVLLACGKTVAADRQVTVREAELLRAIADALNCPMPPFVEALRDAAFAQEP